MLIGYFDYAVILALCYLNYRYRRRLIRVPSGCLTGALIFGLLLPVLSIYVEMRLNGPKPGDLHDNFNYLYVYLRFPLYWGLLVLQGLVLLSRWK